MRVEVIIGRITGAHDPAPIGITVKSGIRTLVRVELTPEDFANCVTGMMVPGTVTKADKP